MKRFNLSAVVVVAAVVGATGAAEARGLLVDAAALPDATRVLFEKQIAQAKAQDPEAFGLVRGVAEGIEALDAKKRGRLAPVSPMLRRLRQRAVWPAVELLAFDGGTPSTVASAKLALEVGLIEAAGDQRDARLLPLWTQIIDGKEPRLSVLRAAVEALAKLETDAVATKLVALSKSDGLRREAALQAMGHCRRLIVARALAEALDARPEDVALAKRVAQSLGDVGNAWAWKTPAPKARAEEGPVRKTAAEALLRAYLAYDGEVRQAASNALMVVDAQATPALIAAARKGATAEQLRALDALGKRFAANPVR